MGRRHLWLSLLGAFVVAVLLLTMRDPYRAEEVQRQLRLAQACRPEALVYLGDYYENRGDEKQLHQLLERQRQCKVIA